MSPARLRSSEWISSVSAVLLFVLMFFHWFDVKLVNNTQLLFLIQSVEPGKSAWEALDFIPIVLTITVITTLGGAALRLVGFSRPFLRIDLLVSILGLVSMLLILFRIVNPPEFGSFDSYGMGMDAITAEGAVRTPAYLALVAAAGIAFGGWRALRAEADGGRSLIWSLSERRPGRAMVVLAIAALAGAALMASGCGSAAEDGSQRAVSWKVERRLGPKQVRLTALVRPCVPQGPLLEPPIIESMDDRVEIELREPPEEADRKGCFLSLLIAHKKITLDRNLDDLVLFDSSTDPPKQRWPR